jgi:putative nucleotidyltransferase with HDIG domain
LDIDSNSNTTFTDESLEMIDLIKNIPSSYYLMMRDYESKQILYKDMIISVLKILSIYDPYTNEHSKNVADLSVLLAKQLKIDEQEIEKIYWAALVHDIGKILIPKEILDKKSRLNEEEYNVVKMHPVWGYETLKSNESLTDIAHVVKHHHERWDGKGYPDGLKTKNIPYYSRIVAVADSYDAMRTDRPYRLTMSKDEAIKEITINSMKQFDPMVVDAFNLIANEL